MRSRSYERALIFAGVALGVASVAGCSSGSDTGEHSAASGGSSNSSAGVGSASGGRAPAAGAGSSGNESAGATGSAGSPDVTSAGTSPGGAPSNASGGSSQGGASHQAGSDAVGGAGANAAGASAGANTAGGAGGAPNLPSLSVYIAGDSTVSDYTLDPQNPKSQAGWGQMLAPNYGTKVKVLNKAVGGRTARRFIQEGLLSAILKVIQPGDYLFVQFGTNDSNTTAKYTLEGVEYPYFADAQSDFKTYLQQYVDGALQKKAIPVLVTPPPRNSAYCNGARSLANYGQAMLDLGKADKVSVVDLGLKTHAHLSAICPKPTSASQEMFFKINADQSIDGTHFQESGARIMAGFVADGVDEAKLGLSAYRKR